MHCYDKITGVNFDLEQFNCVKVLSLWYCKFGIYQQNSSKYIFILNFKQPCFNCSLTLYLYWFIIGKLDNYSVLYIVLTSLLSFDRVEMTMKFMRTQGQWVTQWPVHRTPLNKCQRSFQGYNDRLHWMWRGMEGGGS